MKKTRIIIPILLASAALCGCASGRASDTNTDLVRSELSWATFCATRGHHIDDRTPSTINEYLDSWVGSAQEEEAFANAGLPVR